MRVSPILNSFAAPLLYRSIKIDKTTRQFFASPKMTRDLSHTRQTPTKAFNFGYARAAVYSSHPRTGCFTIGNAQTWDPLTLRIPILHIVDCPPPIRVHCRCLGQISPRKLVVRGAGLRNHRILDLPSDTNRESTVSVVTTLGELCHLRSHIDTLLYYRAPNMRRSTFIYWSKCPDTSLFAAPGWDLFLNRIFAVARLLACPAESVFVNFETVASRNVSPVDREGQTLSEAATRAVQNAYLASLATATPSNGPLLKTEEEARQVKFTFVSMPIYLAEHDWRGDLTEEQVRPWLVGK